MMQSDHTRTAWSSMPDAVEVFVAAHPMDQILYRFFDGEGRLLYIGITGDAAVRWSNHRRDRPWWPLMRRIEIEPHATRADVEAAERAAIIAERPAFNVTHNAARKRLVISGRPTDPRHFSDACHACIGCGRPGGDHAPHRMEWREDGLDAWYRCTEGHEWSGSWGGHWFVYNDCPCAWCRSKGGGQAS